MIGRGKSFGKIILAGEHAVVYGGPALILPIDRFCEVKIISVGAVLSTRPMGRVKDSPLRKINDTEDKHGIVMHVVENFLREFKIENPSTLQIEINSTIPVGRGFGSSAAVITALTKGLMDYFSVGVPHGEPLRKILDFCITCENLIHQKSSGVDIYATWFGRPIWFRKESEKIKLFQEIGEVREVGELWNNCYLIDTGKPGESTGEMVKSAAKLRNARPKFFEKLINKIENETKEMLNSLCYNDTYHCSRVQESIGKSVFTIEKCLEKMGVVSESARNFIKDLRARKIPAKICGAGGRTKGSGIVMALAENKKILEEICHAYKFQILDVKFAI